MKAIVTGGAGFIGSHLTDLLIEKGYEVTVIDNLATGREQNIPKGAKFVKADIAEDELDFTGFDYIFHLAALADIVPSIQNPVAYHHANVNGTIRVLEAARKADVKKVLYAASSSCYGIPDVYPTAEDAEIRPEYPYAVTKNLGEQYMMYWNQIYDLPVVSLRLFNVYGPRARTSGTYGAVFGVFLAQKLKKMPFTVVGDGTQTRDFTFVTDVAKAFWIAAESDVSGEIMNIGSGGTYSVNRITELLEGDVVHIPKRPGEPDQTWADTTKVNKLLGWKAEVSIEEGVSILMDNIDYWREAPVWTPDTIEVATKDWFKYLGKEKE